MKQFNLFRRSLLPLIALIIVTLAGPANAASKEDALREALITNGQACLAKGDEKCARACQLASENLENNDVVNNCHWFYRKSAMGGKLDRGDPTFEKMRHQGRICTGHRDAPCAQACNAATQDPANAELVAECNSEYQRILAANPPPKPKPEESMTLEQRIALMKDKGTYCKAKESYGHDSGTQRAIMNCKRTCLDKRINNANYSDELREKMARQCETAYYNVFGKLGS